eukprot:2612327-Rhodomonas_salina.1
MRPSPPACTPPPASADTPAKPPGSLAGGRGGLRGGECAREAEKEREREGEPAERWLRAAPPPCRTCRQAARD